MDIKATVADITHVESDALVVNLFDGVKHPNGATGAVDKALGYTLTSLIADGEITGKKGELTLVHTLGQITPSRVVVAGLGKREDLTLDIVRQVTAETCRYIRRIGIKHATTIAHGAGIGGMNPELSAQAIAEGALLGLYTFHRHRTKHEDDERELKTLSIVEMDATKLDSLATGIQHGRMMAEGVILARDLVNEPANCMTPTCLANHASKVAQENGLDVDILDQPHMKQLGMGALLGVAMGSSQPPKLIILSHNGDPAHPENNVGLIGKGITFDSGGISIKSAANMWEMKGDMGGGASVIGAMQIIGRLKPNINVVGVIAAAENMPSGSAQRPGDIVTAMNGTSIEVDNTDAEGRMVLADAMCYARDKLGITRMVDVATLTGAIVVALGDVCTGVLGTNQALVDKIIQSGNATGEKIWQLPMFAEYKEKNKSTWADVKNTGGRGAGAITAAYFLSEFTGSARWAHLDIAGTFMADKDKGYTPKGATGIPVRTLVHLVTSLVSE